MTEDSALTINTKEIDGGHVISVAGEVDLSCSEEVRQALSASVGRTPVTVIDMAGVTVIDSSGIASLVEAHQQAKKRSCRLILAGCGAPVMRVLALAKLDDVFNIAATIEDALGDTE